jgi:very-short-patch-repair endonuclease
MSDQTELGEAPVSSDFAQGDVRVGLEKIRRRLLDLTNRNRLLNFKHTKKSSLRIVAADPGEIFGALADGLELSFRPVQRPRRTALPAPSGASSGAAAVAPSAKDHAETLGYSTSFDLPERTAADQRAGPRHELQTLHYPEELEGILRSVTSAARLAIEETGTNMLYLVFGFLEWYESDDSNTERMAPLLLYPVSLERGSPSGEDQTYRYRIRPSGDDVVANLSLQEKMRQDFGLAIPDLEEDEEPEAYFARVRKAISSQERWRLRRQVSLALLSFGKLLMYRDLDPANWPRSGGPAQHPRVREFFHGTGHSGFSIAEDYRIDEVAATGRLPVLIDEADSSQHSALVDAMDGRNLVIAGPPGTGKSQTITNLIGAALQRGDRVLFVAEKLAALEVVRHRLNGAGLGMFCLELHSHKTQKKALLGDLDARIKQHGHYRSPALLDEKLQTLKEHRTRLTEYAELINSPFGQTAQTVHDILWSCRRRRGELSCDTEPLEGLSLRGAEALPLGALEQRRHFFRDFATHLGNVLRGRDAISAHPWFGITRGDLSFQDERDLTRPLEERVRVSAELRGWIERLEAETGCEVEPAARAVAEVAQAVGAIRANPEEVIGDLLPLLESGQVRMKLDAFIARVRRFRELREQIRVELGHVPALNARAAAMLAAELSQSAGVLLRAHTVGDLEARSRELRKALDAIARAAHGVGALARWTGSAIPVSRLTLPVVREALRLAAEAPLDLLPHRSERLEAPNALATLRAAEEAAVPIREMRAELASRHHLDLAPSLAEAREHAMAAGDARWWRFWDVKWKAARRAYQAMYHGGEKPTPARVRADFQQLSVYSEKTRSFAGDTIYREIAGDTFQGIDTPFVDLAQLAAWRAEIRRRLDVEPTFGKPLASALWKLAEERLSALAQECIADPTLAGSAADAETGHRYLADNLARALVPQEREELGQGTERLDGIVAQIGETARRLREAGFGAGLNLTRASALLGLIEEMTRLQEEATADPDTATVLKDHFAGTETNLDRVFHTFAFHDEVARAGLPNALRAWLTAAEGPARLPGLRGAAREAGELTEQLQTALQAFAERAGLDEAQWFGGATAADALPLARIADRAATALESRGSLTEWLDYTRSRLSVRNAGMGAIVNLAEASHVPPNEVRTCFEYVFYNSLAKAVFQLHPQLARFSGLTHEEVRKRFAELDRETILLERQRIAATVDRRPVPFGNSSGPVRTHTELALIHREVSKQTRHIPIRQLVRRAGKALQQLKPCFMMGPLSVAQYLEPDALEFDLIVMDEASQLKPEDALGTICRGKQVIIVGDPMQLPPTSFFDRIGDEEETEDEEDSSQALAEAESILDIARSVYKPGRMLTWHYRSQHESLIAFSNREFYKDRLVVFPSPVARSPEFGIKFVHVQEGRFEGRRNVQEARRVVAAALDHMQRYPKDSLGIVTLNISQRETIENELEQRLRTDAVARAFVERHNEGLEPLFVKNLENVQGDERDVIFISITYGPDRHGNVFQRFGPINSQVGHRRLNVLFTRAKKRVMVFSSLLAEQIQVQPTSKWGVRALKGYLHFAQTGILEQATFTGRAPDSDFEVEVADALRRRGLDVVAQVGVAGYFIDLAVKHPRVPDRYVLGVECDGATYHSSRSARDRDRLRESVLRNLQWDIARVWSTDWFRNPDAEADRIAARVQAIVEAEQARGAVYLVETVEDAGAKPAAVKPNATSLTVEKARALLIELREERIHPAHPNAPAGSGILRDSMLDALLRQRPTSRTEWIDRIPLDLRLDTDPDQMNHLDEIVGIVARIR